MNRERIQSIPVGLNTVLVLTPLWLLLYYFKDDIAGFLIYNVFSMSAVSEVAQSAVFFISTGIKIYLLLGMFIFIMSLIRTYFPVETVRQKLSSMPVLPANIMAGFFGILAPFCSCSAVPLFISFVEAGIPLGLTFTFLIASPLVNEIVIIMLAGLFGIRVAIIYTLSGLSLAIVAGFIIDRLRLEKYLPDWLLNFRSNKNVKIQARNAAGRVSEAIQSVVDVFKRTWMYILAGIIIGAAIHGYVPENWISNLVTGEHWYSLPLAILAGVPLYACSASVAPVAFALVDKGLPLGTALAFIMAVAGLSLPELILLKKVLSVRLLIIFSGIVSIGIVVIGVFFNWLF